ncbi:hypothetical protein [Actinomadura formosensis]|uniref:hypothetical protein n=1 Tax=Actinomadura formosensis TaxID=60706 RepID=UPI00082CAA7F|nr:hypothetical protein [Actinomadura formosensis]
MPAVIRSEWTKFRTVRSTVWCLLTAVSLMLVLAVLQSSASTFTPRAADEPADRFQFVRQPVTGDVTIVARVRAQQASHPWAKAGVIIKEHLAYVAVMLTPRHGVRMRSGTITDFAGSPTPAPRWLKLARTGSTITGYESSDGATWRRVGAVTLSGLAQAVEVGLFVASPDEVRVVGTPAAKRYETVHTVGRATFDMVAVTPQPLVGWSSQDVAPPPVPGRTEPPAPPAGSTARSGGEFTLTGSGELGPPEPDHDPTRLDAALSGVTVGVILFVTIGTLFMTAEYRRNLTWTTFVATPRRGRVLAAKALVLGVTTFAAGLVAIGAAFWLSQPILHDHGYRPPYFPDPSAATAVRVIVGSAAFLALLALFSLGVGVILRRTTGAIATVMALVFVPQITAPALPADVGAPLLEVTPVAGMSVGYPWSGVAVLAGYAAAALGVGYWLLCRRDA